MTQATIYHNPRCSKSRATLALLEQQDVSINIVKYLEATPTEQELKELLRLLDLDVRQVLRTGEADYKAHNFADDQLAESEILKLITQYPKVLERPIVTFNGQAVIGRPPENVLSLFE